MKLKTFLTIFSFFLLIHGASSHLSGGEDVAVDGYIIDFGHTPENPKAGDTVHFNLVLVNETTEEMLEYDSVWVRVTTRDTTVFTGEFEPQAGTTTFTQKLSDGGHYEVTTRFKASGETLVEHDFDLEVEKEQKTLLERYGMGFTFFIIQVILLVLIVSGLIFLKYVKDS